MNGHKNGEPVREALLALECEMQSLLVLVRFLVQLGQEFVGYQVHVIFQSICHCG